MKNKDSEWYDQKIESIRKRKRKLYLVLEPKMRKRIKEDLKREQRAAKRSERNCLKQRIEEEIDGLDIQYKKE